MAHDPRPTMQTALAAAEAGEFGKADTLASEALELSGGSCAMAVLSAQILLDAQRYVDAWRMAGRARQADPANPLANAYAALAQIAQGDYARAAELLHRKELPDSSNLQLRLLVECELALDRIRTEPPELAAPLELTPADFRIAPVLHWVQERWYGHKDRRRLDKARRLVKRGQADAAWVLASDEWAMDSRFTPGHGPMMEFAQPCCKLLRGRAQKAKRFTDDQALQLAEVSALTGDFETTRKQLHRLRQGGKGRDLKISVNLIAGLTQFWTDETDPAIASLESVVKDDREATLALYFLGLAHLRQDKLAQARRAFTQLCRYEPWRGTQSLLALRDELNGSVTA
jgi:tetratricopeptide (TPR) repeat protein